MTPYKSRMLRICVLFAVLTLAGPTMICAQEAPKYWIFLEGKPDSESAAITERARERRSRRGLDQQELLDRNVSRSYVEDLQRMGARIVVESRWLNAVSAHLPPELLDRVRSLSFVRSIRPVARLDRAPPPASEILDAPSKQADLDYGPSQAQLAVMNAINPLEQGIDGTGVRLGFLDTSFGDFDHPAFGHLIQDGRLIEVRDFVGVPQPAASHGMSVASVAIGNDAGQLVGPAHGAEVLAGITEYVPTETNREEDYFVAGIEWMEAMGADVVNVSLGYTTFDKGERSYGPEDLDGNTGVTTIAADRAVSLGVAMVVSAGNEACSSPDRCWYYIGTPADGDSVISVGAIRADSVRSSFSSFGPTADGRIKPDVAAMGSGVYLAVPGGYGRSNGTSFSSPLVAGVVCQMLQVNPNLTPVQIRALLRSTASRSTSPNNELGWGIVNAAAAVEVAARSGIGGGEDVELSASPYPNPATDDLFVHINAGVTTQVSLDVFDLLGRRVEGNVVGYLTPGETTLRVPTHRLASGVYLFVVTTDDRRVSGTFIIAR